MSNEFITLLVAAISAFSALFGVGIGSFCSYYISRQQIKATVLSGNRQQWINTLRDCIADFQTKARIAIVEADLANHKQTSMAANLMNHDKAMKTICFLSNKIALLVNTDETDHANLISRIKDLESHCIDGDPGDREKESMLQEAITTIGQKILKREWERVKKGK